MLNLYNELETHKKVFVLFAVCSLVIAPFFVFAKRPVGSLDSIDQNGVVSGWAIDPDTSSKSIQVYFYTEDPSGQKMKIGSVLANQPRSDVNQSTGYSGNHGFVWNIPVKYQTASHVIYAYGVDSSRKSRKQNLVGSPKTFAYTGISTVSVIEPVNGTMVSGMANVSATATGDTGIAGVQIKLDGANLGAEITLPPYATGWNTASSTNGNHTLTAVARDTVGHSKTSPRMTVTVKNGGVSDTQAPTVPTNLSASVVSSSQINLSWTASTDNVGIAGYKIFKNGAQIATVNGTTYSSTGLTAATSYSYTVSAYDSAGNVSAQSAGKSATTKSDTVTASGDASIQSDFSGSPIVLTTTQRFAGAISSLTWKGKEFINTWDHGRELQSAASFDDKGEYYNPTEAGSEYDGTGSKSTSVVKSMKTYTDADGHPVLESDTQMAFWKLVGNEKLSNHVLHKKITIGFHGIPNVIEHLITYKVPEAHTGVDFEVITAYMPPEFSTFWTYDPITKTLASLSYDPYEQLTPVIFSTPDNKYALGVYSPKAKETPMTGYGRWRFNLPYAGNSTVKWNCVYRERNGVPIGDHNYSCYSIIGSLDEVKAGMDALYKYFHP